MKKKSIKAVVKRLLLNNSRLWILVGGISFIIVALFSFSKVYDQFEFGLYDLRFKIKPKVQQWKGLSLLDIDDSSIINAGEFPWPRNYYAKGVEILKERDARNFLFDIQFMDKSPRFVDKDRLSALRDKIRTRQKISAEDVDAAAVDNDAVLAAAVKSFKHNILSYSFEKQELFSSDNSPESRIRIEAMKLFIKKATVPIPAGRDKAFAACVDPARKMVHPPIPPLVDAGNLFGYVDSDPDLDGAIRKIRLIRVFEGRIYFHMALTLLSDLCGVKKEAIEIIPGRYIALRNALNPVTMIREDIIIPVDAKCAMYINWAGNYEETFNHVSFYALLEYNMVKDDIHAWMDETEVQSGKPDRSILYGRRQQVYDEMNAAKSDAQRHALFMQYNEILEKIAAVEDGYVVSIKEQRSAAARAYEADKTPEKKTVLSDVDNMLTAIRIVRDVDALKDAVCVTGYTANASQDIGAIPVQSQFYMVGTYPNIINTVLQKAFVHKTDKRIEILIMLIFALGIAFTVQRQNAKMSILISIAALAVYALFNMMLFSFAGLWIDLLGISLALILPSLSIIGVKFLSEESQKRFIKDTFSMYLSKQVVDELIKDPEMVKLGGEEQEITIFFSDIKGFTSISENMTPAMLVKLLNEYLSDMTEIILRNRGTVDKFIGDAIMAFYGAPFHFDDHALEACYAAIDMQEKLEDMRKVWKKHGHENIYSRFGINTGTAVVGNMGSRDRLSYTAMGDSVNLASRLEGANKYYGTYSMISESTYELVKHRMDVRYLDKIKVVGKATPISVYELITRKGHLTKEQKELIEIFNNGIELFTQQEWEKAKKMFTHALKVNKDDGPSKTYIDRCSEFIIKPPSKKWDGVYTMKSK